MRGYGISGREHAWAGATQAHSERNERKGGGAALQWWVKESRRLWCGELAEAKVGTADGALLLRELDGTTARDDAGERNVHDRCDGREQCLESQRLWCCSREV